MTDRPTYLSRTGRVYRSVTTILGEAQNPEPLMGWANRLGLEGKALSEARDAIYLGRGVHGHLEHMPLDTATPTVPSEASGNVSKTLAQFCGWWPAWRQAKGLRVVAREVQLVHDTMGVGGTFDCLCTDEDGLPVIVDWKTSSRVRDSHVAQLAAYGDLLADGRANLANITVPCLGTRPVRGYVVQLRPLAAPKAYFISPADMDDGLILWRAAVKLTRARWRIDRALRQQAKALSMAAKVAKGKPSG